MVWLIYMDNGECTILPAGTDSVNAWHGLPLCVPWWWARVCVPVFCWDCWDFLVSRWRIAGLSATPDRLLSGRTPARAAAPGTNTDVALLPISNHRYTDSMRTTDKMTNPLQTKDAEAAEQWSSKVRSAWKTLPGYKPMKFRTYDLFLIRLSKNATSRIYTLKLLQLELALLSANSWPFDQPYS